MTPSRQRHSTPVSNNKNDNSIGCELRHDRHGTASVHTQMYFNLAGYIELELPAKPATGSALGLTSGPSQPFGCRTGDVSRSPAADIPMPLFTALFLISTIRAHPLTQGCAPHTST